MTVWGMDKASRDAGANPIAICEAAMVPLVLFLCKDRIQNRQVLFFLDNSVALFSMVKGTSNQPWVARCTHVMGFVCLQVNSNTWFEFVDSKSNWSDSVSRKLADCPFCKKHGIPVEKVEIPEYWWTMSLSEMKVFLLRDLEK